MEYFANFTCNIHNNPFECPDHIMYIHNDTYGIIVHDGGESYITINYCPWCGKKLQHD